MNKFLILALLALASCASNTQSSSETPSWYVTPKQNNAENLYGISVGHTLEESTKYALADAASRLMVSLSAESTLTREEDRSGVNEEMRQKVRQNIEKISFTGFKVSRSQKVGVQIFTEVEIPRDSFLREQRERIEFVEKKISDLDKNSAGKNTIQRRNSLLKILDLGKELELKSRIVAGSGENIDLKSKLNRLADFSNQLEKLSDKVEFYFEINSPQQIAKIIRSALNKEKLKVSPSRDESNANQVVIRVRSSSRSNKIYEAFLTKLQIDFENIAEGKVVASNEIEVTGSSSISEKESEAAALSTLAEKISADGILKIIGITD
ncbi:MAG: LPP20 family lipoprotein [Rickettsiales bacterium]|nr:LPP20 family lipoprotein [Rickettsiales bacterium]